LFFFRYTIMLLRYYGIHMSLRHKIFSAETLVASRTYRRDANEITDRPKFVSESAECRQIIRQRKRGNLRISAYHCCTIVFVSSLLHTKKKKNFLPWAMSPRLYCRTEGFVFSTSLLAIPRPLIRPKIVIPAKWLPAIWEKVSLLLSSHLRYP